MMATSHKTHHLVTPAVVLLLFIFICNYSLSSARPLNDFLSRAAIEAKEATTDGVLALPLDGDRPKPQALPCDHMVRIKNSHVGSMIRAPTPRLAGKYGAMILSMLKGPVPSSGPSKGSNGVKN